MTARLRAAGLLIALTAGACAPKTFRFPTDPGTPDPGALDRFRTQATRCEDVKAISAEAGLSGRAGGQRLRGRLHLGVTQSGDIRVEAVAPFGPPVFILAGRGGQATLLLPRDARVVERAPPADIIESLAGVSVEPDDLLALLTGCVGASSAVSASRHGDDLVQVSADGADVWFRWRGDGLQLVAARQGDLMVEYDEVVGSAPRVVRLLKRGDGQLPVDLRLSLAQVELNPTLPPEAFTVDVPASARPMTLDELRQSGPLGQSAPSNRSRAEPPTDP